MYDEWVQINVSHLAQERCGSVLQKFPSAAGGTVVQAVVQSLASSLGISSGICEPSLLVSDEEVNWCMEVICFGLHLPISEHDAIKNCVNVYCEWLMSLTPECKICVPEPVQIDANHYSRRMLRHLYNVFKPRGDLRDTDTVSKQAVLCHRVLRTLQTLAIKSNTIDHETWHDLLCFLLAINDVLLSTPARRDDISSHLCDRIVTVLFEVWVVASARCFPTPPLWKTLRSLSTTWRHRAPLIDQWNRMNRILTAKLLPNMYGATFPVPKLDDVESHITALLSPQHVVQTWYRILHTIDNPVDLQKSEVIFSHRDRDPDESNVLPLIFYKAMLGVSNLVDMFLGMCPDDVEQHDIHPPMTSHPVSHAPPNATPPNQRKTKSTKGKDKILPHILPQKSSASNSMASGSINSIASVASPAVTPTQSHSLSFPRPLPFYRRPCVNSLLHLFGSWFFDASIPPLPLDRVSITTVSSEDGESVDSRTSSIQEGVAPNSVVSAPLSLRSGVYDVESFECGQAVAMGALCRLFGSKQTGEEILPVYLARFVLCVKSGLANFEQQPQIAANIILNSADLFRQDTEGINGLLPVFIATLESLLLFHGESTLRSVTMVNQVELRCSAINILMSTMCLPLHFCELTLKDFHTSRETSFMSLRGRLVALLFGALNSEQDSINTQLLLALLFQCIIDTAAYEAAEPAPLVDNSLSLLDRGICVICERLIGAWKSDVNVSLAALELLSALARTKHASQLRDRCFQCVKWLCEFIVYQCQRPPYLHSRDLHSTIVAAYQCLTIWLVEHPQLMDDPACVNGVLEVLELGISGSKSQAKSSDMPQMKGEKELKPSSMRVRDAAEAVLSCLMDYIGYFPNTAGPEAVSSLFDEATILKQCKRYQSLPAGTDPTKYFRYFYNQNSVIIAILEESLIDTNWDGTITMIIRVPFGRHTWSVQLRHIPRSKHLIDSWAERPKPGPEPALLPACLPSNYKPNYYPDTIGEIPLCKIDRLIPDADRDLDLSAEEIELRDLIIPRQASIEKVIEERHRPPCIIACSPNRPPSHPLQSSRLLLQHLEFLTLDEMSLNGGNGGASSVQMIENDGELRSALESLDRFSSRTADTVFVFYVRHGQVKATDILNNVTSSRLVHPQFLEFIRSLGWPVDVSMHSGWTGHVDSAWKYAGSDDINIADLPSDHGGSLYSGRHQVLYWSDVLSEMAFVVPSSNSSKMSSSDDSTNSTKKREKSLTPDDASRSSGDSGCAGGIPERPPRSLNLDGGMTKKRSSTINTVTDVKVLVVWLECFEDWATFPLEGLVPHIETGLEPATSVASRPDHFIIFVHPLNNGTFRIKLQQHETIKTRFSSGLPLVDGSVVSRRALGTLVRYTALNVCRRRRLEAELCPAPHVRRRAKIQDIGKRFKCIPLGAPLYRRLFT